ncbi:MAG: M1 family metallopeptidase [Bacteroidota bacterium]
MRWTTKISRWMTMGISLVVLAACSTTEPMQESATTTKDTASESGALPVDQIERPIPYELDVPANYKRAIERGTRTQEGKPGEDYWQQYAKYDLDARVMPETKMVEGSGTITYFNNSPDTLDFLFMELVQNLHKEGAVRNEFSEVTGGVDIKSMRVNDMALMADTNAGPRYQPFGTMMRVAPAKPLTPGDSAVIEVEWSFKVPQAGASGRMGYSEDNLMYIAYWYPKMSVYDDVVGWYTDQFLGLAEFYDEFADFNLSITAPEHWMVMATGKFQNPEVLQDDIRERFMMAQESDTTVNIISEDDFGSITEPTDDGMVTWNFKAHKVRDAAFSVTYESIWDARRTPVGDLDGDGQTDYSRMDAFYRTTAPLWNDVADFAAHSITHISNHTETPYPWPHMSAVEGADIIGGGMEFPMMTIIGDYTSRGSDALYSVTAHELAHMWVPMILSTNERRYSWMDEGTTTFNEGEAHEDYREGVNYHRIDQQGYLRITQTDLEGEMMRWSNFHYNGYAFGVASYSKPASVLVALRELLGEETFYEAYHEYFDRWEYKHPYPWDMFNTFEDVSGQELDWFWRSWYYETWTLDQGIESVTSRENTTTINIHDYGNIPMPVPLEITLENGETISKKVPVQRWLNGYRDATLTVQTDSPVVNVEIDASGNYPDTDRTNNIWSAE